MDGERTQRAMARIEAAVARIECASSQRPAMTGAVGDPELERKYAALRSETGAALAELDRLLGAIAP
ncbi:MAG TPA: hypothetical protein VLM18_04340 [Croceibacterium sp.]|nr:hypothetical protein [Croceibacterium sp.]